MAAIDPQVAHRRARHAAVARGVRAGERPAADLDDTGRDLAEANIAAYIAKVLADCPPLSDEQRTRLAELLRPARESA